MPDSHAVFVYGTLREPTVQQALFDRTVAGQETLLHGWAAYESQESGFLFIKPGADRSVRGLVLRLTEEELAMADAWEEVPLYERERVKVMTDRGLEEVWTYTRRAAEGLLHQGASASVHPLDQVAAWARETCEKMKRR